MTIFKCVGYFICICFKDSASLCFSCAVFLPSFLPYFCFLACGFVCFFLFYLAAQNILGYDIRIIGKVGRGGIYLLIEKINCLKYVVTNTPEYRISASLLGKAIL
jgi:hypothetical protein